MGQQRTQEILNVINAAGMAETGDGHPATAHSHSIRLSAMPTRCAIGDHPARRLTLTEQELGLALIGCQSVPVTVVLPAADGPLRAM